MLLNNLYDLIIKYGIQKDPRGNKISGYFKRIRGEYNKLDAQGRKFFDKESFKNPFSDTRILYGDGKTNIKNIMVGIDIETAEILLADKIRAKDGLDLVVSHHPEGCAFAGLSEVMQVQEDILLRCGLKEDVVKDMLQERVREVSRKIHSANHSRAVDAARLMDMPFLSCHTPADNFVAKALQSGFDSYRPKRLKDSVSMLLKIKEYQSAARNKSGPKIILGKPENKTGKVLVDMTGGTEGPKGIFPRLSQAGIDTLVCMHLSEEHFSKIKTEHINVIIAGHIASDNLGMNLLLDKIQSREKLQIISCSGFNRIERPAGKGILN